jgi:hypothetical protein
MFPSRRQLRSSLVALAATIGTFLAVAGVAEAGMAEGRRRDPASASCCAGRPETCNSGCCTSLASAPALSRTGTDESAAPADLTPSRTTCTPTACQCRSSKPIAPDSKPDRRTASDRFNLGESLSSAWVGHALSPVPATLVLRDAGGSLKRPFHLLTTHLRFY